VATQGSEAAGLGCLLSKRAASLQPQRPRPLLLLLPSHSTLASSSAHLGAGVGLVGHVLSVQHIAHHLGAGSGRQARLEARHGWRVVLERAPQGPRCQVIQSCPSIKRQKTEHPCPCQLHSPARCLRRGSGRGTARRGVQVAVERQASQEAVPAGAVLQPPAFLPARQLCQWQPGLAITAAADGCL